MAEYESVSAITDPQAVVKPNVIGWTCGDFGFASNESP
jgi:hypothetical protein